MEKWFSLHHSMFTHTSCIHWPRLTLTDSISSKVTKVIMIIMMTNIKLFLKKDLPAMVTSKTKVMRPAPNECV